MDNSQENMEYYRKQFQLYFSHCLSLLGTPSRLSLRGWLGRQSWLCSRDSLTAGTLGWRWCSEEYISVVANISLQCLEYLWTQKIV